MALHDHKTLVCDNDLMEGRSGWFYDGYSPSIHIHYGEEGSDQQMILCGGDDGNIYQLAGESDNSTDIACQVRTPSEDQHDARYNKLYGDIMFDVLGGGGDISATPGFDLHTTTSSATTVNNSARTQVPIPVGTNWASGKNVSLDLSWSHNNNRSYFYAWEPRFTENTAALSAKSWKTDALTHDLPGYFYHGYLYLVHVSTADLTFSVIDDTGTSTDVTVTSSGGSHNKDFIRLPVLKGTIFTYKISCSTAFSVDGDESELLVKPWGSTEEWKRVKIFQDIPVGSAA